MAQCFYFLSLTSGPSPFSALRITPAASRARYTASTVRGFNSSPASSRVTVLSET